MAFRAKDTLLLGSGRQDLKMHLHVILCDPAGDPPAVIIVSFNTPTPYTDPTLILYPEHHPFFNRPTAVSYNLMRQITVAELERREQARNDDDFQRRRPIPEHVYRLIVGGARMSEVVPKGILTILEERLPF